MTEQIDRNPLVSVIIPSYNHKPYVESAILSVLNQSYRNTELIVIDDGSTDGSAEFLTELNKEHPFIFLSQKNRGLSKTLNRGISMAKGSYLSLLASDDVFLPHKLETLVAAMEQSERDVAVVCGDAAFMDGDGHPVERASGNNRYATFINYYQAAFPAIDIKGAFGSYRTLIYNNHIPAMSALMRRSAVEDIGLFSEDKALEDWCLWLRMARRFSIRYIDDVVARYRVYEANSSITLSMRLTLDALDLLDREKPFCVQRDCLREWRDNYYRTLFTLLEKGEIVRVLRRLRLRDIPSFLTHNFLRIISKRLGRNRR
ncbi:MAG: glycosyltransferase [Halieaceae bacterium]|nr:glycosyltransferase [Halieaceae bacterium]